MKIEIKIMKLLLSKKHMPNISMNILKEEQEKFSNIELEILDRLISNVIGRNRVEYFNLNKSNFKTSKEYNLFFDKISEENFENFIEDDWHHFLLYMGYSKSKLNFSNTDGLTFKEPSFTIESTKMIPFVKTKFRENYNLEASRHERK